MADLEPEFMAPASSSSAATLEPEFMASPKSPDQGVSAPQIPSEKASAAVEASNKSGFPIPFVYNNMDAVQHAIKLREADDLQHSSPITHSQMDDPRALDDRHNFAAHEAVLSEGKPPNIFKQAFRYLTDAAPEVLNAEAMNMMSVAEAKGVSPETVTPEMQREFAQEKGLATQQTNHQFQSTVMLGAMAIGLPISGEAALPYIWHGAKGIATFEALNKMIPVDKFIPAEASDQVKTVIEMVDFMGKSVLSAGLSGAVRPVSEFMKAKIAEKGIKLPEGKLTNIINNALSRLPKMRTPPTAEQSLTTLANLTKDASAAKTNPDFHAEFIQKTADEYDKGTIQMPAEKFHEYFQGKGMNPMEEMSKLGATEESGVLNIPTGKFLSQYADGEHIKGLSKDVQFKATVPDESEPPSPGIPEPDPAAVNFRVVHHGDTPFDVSQEPLPEHAAQGAKNQRQTHPTIDQEKKVGPIGMLPQGIEQIKSAKGKLGKIDRVISGESGRTQETAKVLGGISEEKKAGGESPPSRQSTEKTLPGQQGKGGESSSPDQSLFPVEKGALPSSITRHPDFVKVTSDAAAVVRKYAKDRGEEPSPEFTKKLYGELHDVLGEARLSKPENRAEVYKRLNAKYPDITAEWLALRHKMQMDVAEDHFNLNVAGQYGNIRPEAGLEAEKMTGRKGVDHVVDPRLNPMDIGDKGSVPIKEYKPLLEAEMDRASKDPEYKIFGKETWGEIQDRWISALQDAANQSKHGDTVGIAAHSDFAKWAELYAENGGKPISGEMIKRMADKEGIKPGAVTSFKVNPDKGLFESASKYSPEAEEARIVKEQIKDNLEGKNQEPLDNITATKNPVKTFLDISGKERKFTGDIEKDRYALEAANERDNIHAYQILGKTMGTPEDYEAIYHHLENDKEPLTDRQKEILEQEIEPLRKAARKAFYSLKEKEVPVAPDDYSPRIVADRGGSIERMKAGFRGIAQSGLLRSSTGALRSKVMWALEDAEGNRKVVSIKGGAVTEWNDKIPSYMGERRLPVKVLGGQKVGGILEPKTFMDKTGKEWDIKPATTKEIEAQTSLKYHKNALVTQIQSFLNLRKVQRSVEFIENLKASPEFNEFAVKINTPEYDKLLAEDPKGFRASSVPQLRGYVFPNRIASAFDDFYVKRDVDGISAAYRKINGVLRNSIFFNPLIHVPNILNHWGVDRGAIDWAKPGSYETLSNTTMRAWRAVTTMNQDYLDVLDKGGNLLFAKTKLENLSELLLQKAGMELNANKGFAAKASEALGYANPARLVKAMYDFSGKVTWASNDIATMQRIFERMEHGMTMEDAIEETGKHIPNYRVPSEVLGSRNIATLMRGDNGLTMFGAYHYGALRSYGEMLKDLKDGLTGKAPPEKVAHTVDKIAALAIATYVVYPILDQFAQGLTGNPNASFRRSGASTLPDNLAKFREKAISRQGASYVDFARVLESVVTPSIGAKLAFEFWSGRDMYNGRPISPAQKLMSAISPLDYARRMHSGEMKADQFGYGLFGIKVPNHRSR